MPRRILVVDDHDIVRTGVKALLASASGWEICGEASDGSEAVQKVQQLSPDVVLLDLTMPKMNGFEAAEKIRQIAPQVKLLFFSMHSLPGASRYTNADGFVSKAHAQRDLLTALENL